jgi:hypothetical protein
MLMKVLVGCLIFLVDLVIEPIVYNQMELVSDARRDLCAVSITSILTFSPGFPANSKAIIADEIKNAGSLLKDISQKGFFNTIAPSTESTCVHRICEDVMSKAQGHLTRKQPIESLLFDNFNDETDNSHRVYYNETKRFTDNIISISPEHFSIKIKGDDEYLRAETSAHTKLVLESLSKGKNDRKKVLIVEFNGARFKAKLEVSHVLGSQVNTSRFVISDLLKSQLGVASMKRLKDGKFQLHIPVPTSIGFSNYTPVADEGINLTHSHPDDEDEMDIDSDGAENMDIDLEDTRSIDENSNSSEDRIDDYTYGQRTRPLNDPAPVQDPVARAKKKWYSFPTNIQWKEKGQKAKVE